MAINGLWNKRSGPGGGTRHLHQKSFRFQSVEIFDGDEIGSTHVIKICLSLGEVPLLSVQKRVIAENDNFAFANDNQFVANAAAA